jgi:hypothetical protein
LLVEVLFFSFRLFLASFWGFAEEDASSKDATERSGVYGSEVWRFMLLLFSWDLLLHVYAKVFIHFYRGTLLHLSALLLLLLLNLLSLLYKVLLCGKLMGIGMQGTLMSFTSRKALKNKQVLATMESKP